MIRRSLLIFAAYLLGIMTAPNTGKKTRGIMKTRLRNFLDRRR